MHYIQYKLNFLHRSSYTHLPDNATALIKGDDWLSCFVIQVQALLDGLLVVISAAAGLTALQKPLDHRLCFCIDVQQQAGFADLE